MSATASSSKQWPDPFGLALLILIALNLNSAYFMFWGTEALFSPLILLLTIILFVRYFDTHGITNLYAYFVITISAYLAIAWITGLLNLRNDTRYVSSYFSTILLVSAIYFWLTSIDGAALRKVLVALKYLLLASCLFVVLSDVLAPYRMQQPIDEELLRQMGDSLQAMTEVVRASGFFANPNEAAMAALYCIVLIVAVPSRQLNWRVVQFFLAAAALLMTFSKAGMLTLIFLSTVFLLTRRSFATLLIAGISAGILLFGLWYVFDQDLFNLSTEQRARLADVINLATGEINEKTTTGRSILVEIGLQKISETFPWGWGLGQFHAMEGGIRAADSLGQYAKWQGIHNTFLMILGEAGLVPLLMLLTFLAGVIISGMRSPYRNIIVGFTVILIVDMLTAHHVFQIRLTNITTAVVLALLAASKVRIEMPARSKLVPLAPT